MKFLFNTAQLIPYRIQGNQEKQCIAFGNLSNSVIFKLRQVIAIETKIIFISSLKVFKKKNKPKLNIEIAKIVKIKK